MSKRKLLNLDNIIDEVLLEEIAETKPTLLEISAKDWHDKYHSDVPMDVFAQIMGKDIKKTPVREFFLNYYLNGIDIGMISKVVAMYEELDSNEKKWFAEKVQYNEFESFTECYYALSQLTNLRTYKNEFKQSTVNEKFYAENCISLFEDDNWLVLCPLTPFASRKYCNNGNHWCTCSSSFMTYFQQYTIEEDAALISFLNKKDPEASVQISIDGKGNIKELCDFFDQSLENLPEGLPIDVNDVDVNKLVQLTKKATKISTSHGKYSPREASNIAYKFLNDTLEPSDYSPYMTQSYTYNGIAIMLLGIIPETKTLFFTIKSNEYDFSGIFFVIRNTRGQIYLSNANFVPAMGDAKNLSKFNFSFLGYNIGNKELLFFSKSDQKVYDLGKKFDIEYDKIYRMWPNYHYYPYLTVDYYGNAREYYKFNGEHLTDSEKITLPVLNKQVKLEVTKNDGIVFAKIIPLVELDRVEFTAGMLVYKSVDVDSEYSFMKSQTHYMFDPVDFSFVCKVNSFVTLNNADYAFYLGAYDLSAEYMCICPFTIFGKNINVLFKLVALKPSTKLLTTGFDYQGIIENFDNAFGENGGFTQLKEKLNNAIITEQGPYPLFDVLYNFFSKEAAKRPQAAPALATINESRMLNEISAKDWHDKYLQDIPETIFYQIMGKDKKKTPIKELILKFYKQFYDYAMNIGEIDTRITVLQNINNNSIDLAKRCDELNAEETQDILDMIQHNEIDGFPTFDKVLRSIENERKYTGDIEGDGFKMYATNCVNIYEDDEWLVLCPLTDDASRKYCNNGNHWCTCSTSYKQYFPTYTYKASSCIISFLCKKTYVSSFQIQINQNGELVSCCDFYDESRKSDYCNRVFPNFEKVLDKIYQISEELVIQTRVRSGYKYEREWTDRQAVNIAVKEIKNRGQNTEENINAKGLTIYQPSEFPKSGFFTGTVVKNNGVIIRYLYNNKFGAEILDVTSAGAPQHLVFCTYDKPSIDECKETCVPIATMWDDSGNNANMLMYDKSTGHVHLLLDDYVSPEDIYVEFQQFMPVVSFVFKNEPNKPKVLRYNFKGQLVNDENNPLLTQVAFDLPEEWGGKIIANLNYEGRGEVKIPGQENSTRFWCRGDITLVTKMSYGEREGLIYSVQTSSVLAHIRNFDSISFNSRYGKNTIHIDSNQFRVTSIREYSLGLNISYIGEQLDIDRWMPINYICTYENGMLFSCDTFSDLLEESPSSRQSFFKHSIEKIKPNIDYMIEGEFLNGETLYDKIKKYLL